MKQTFIVAFKVEVEAGSKELTVEDMLGEVEQMTTAGGLATYNHFVGKLTKNVGWNKNIDVLFQLWLEERCKRMWP